MLGCTLAGQSLTRCREFSHESVRVASRREDCWVRVAPLARPVPGPHFARIPESLWKHRTGAVRTEVPRQVDFSDNPAKSVDECCRIPEPLW